MLSYLFQNDIHVGIGGGQYNEVRNNVMYNAKYGSISVDFRGRGTALSSMLVDRLHVSAIFFICLHVSSLFVFVNV